MLMTDVVPIYPHVRGTVDKYSADICTWGGGTSQLIVCVSLTAIPHHQSMRPFHLMTMSRPDTSPLVGAPEPHSHNALSKENTREVCCSTEFVLLSFP